ncbi:AGE family epimerase/isomerase [Brevundimonas fluminis]|uniref:AGE family epimerase/isomerase n=1 Tax=Brevundimonas fluminis TaxID=2487274 RepID=UPI000F657592|nr:AGE family epimerase/isomerase [Brevundimonas fluminis]
MSSEFPPASRRLEEWLTRSAYPLWATAGVDADGGFFERIDGSGCPVRGPRRARVLGRQMYSFARAPALGWTGDAAAVVRHGLAALPRFLRPDGLAHARVDDDGTPIQEPIDLYDQAFVLFGLAHALPFADDAAEVAATARRMREALKVHSHPGGGFEEAVPRTLPLKANPHMHLFEAGLAWSEVEGLPDGAAWDAFADGLAELALKRFVDPATGAVHEFYDGDWTRMTGEREIVEPGHQFEWGWLLTRWGMARGRADAVDVGERLIALGEAQGLDAKTGVTVGELDGALRPRPFHARLWAQGERIKAWAQAAMRAPEPARRALALERMEAAAAALELFLQGPPPGAWRDRMGSDRTIVEEAAPASSLYHIVGAVEEAARARGRL